jgi:hypothetical protein
MSRPIPTLPRPSLATRLAALGSACAITGVIVLVHAVDLGELGAHVVATEATTPTVVASVTAAAPHVDAAR